jgi:hypothetical protein
VHEPTLEGLVPRRGTPRPLVSTTALAGLPACGAGFSPSIPAFPIPQESVALGISPVTVAGAAAFRTGTGGPGPIAFPLRLS